MFHNLGVKLLCLLVATLLWIQAASGDLQEREVVLPLVVVGLADSLAVARSRMPDEVNVRLRESRLRLLLSDVWRRDLGRVELDLKEFGAGSHRIPLIPRDVESEAVALAILSPTSIGVRIQPRESRAVVVDVTTEGTLPQGFATAGSVEVTPESVTVDGPKDVVEDIDLVATEPVRLDRRRTSFRETVALVPPAPDVTLRPREVLVSIGVEEMIERVFDEVLVTVFADGDAMPERVRLDPTTVRVTVVGAAGVVRGLGPEDISVRVPIDPAVRGIAEVPVEVVAIDGIVRSAVDPRSIQVLVDVPDSVVTDAGDRR